ncbi:glycerate kinase type-2 family protein [Desulfogranum mediterraneum]|uniref:glycerate kinase type-2 family protein n=1 Tax=Desulfogranum mediterraneum TaxID=160661 RepID=UPI00048FE840|nr:glycerate kinase [Desulfogranum mediterraneum]
MTGKLDQLRRDAVAIFQAGLAAVAPGAAIRRFCQLEEGVLRVNGKSYPLDAFNRVVVLGTGKGGASMAKAMEELLGEHISEGLITVKYRHLEQLSTIELIEAGHPLPDMNGHAGARRIFQLASQADEKTLVICLISGGGSALLPLPVAGVSLDDKQQTTKVLLACGATIHEMNTIRKHLSAIKGGGLARAVYPATLITLILSDVVGDDLDSIASGPAVPDPTTYADCLSILDRYAIRQQLPSTVLRHLEDGAAGTVPETPKRGDRIFSRTDNVIIARNCDALIAAKRKAAELGYHTLALSSMLEGDTRESAAMHMAIAREVARYELSVAKPACILSGGETTVTIKGTGKGGRSQEFALAAALKMGEMKNSVVLCAGTDGTDGPTDAAGAISDSSTLEQARSLGLDPAAYLENNDAYHFFHALGSLYITGPTNTNVMDLRLILVG